MFSRRSARERRRALNGKPRCSFLFQKAPGCTFCWILPPKSYVLPRSGGIWGPNSYRLAHAFDTTIIHSRVFALILDAKLLKMFTYVLWNISKFSKNGTFQFSFLSSITRNCRLLESDIPLLNHQNPAEK